MTGFYLGGISIDVAFSGVYEVDNIEGIPAHKRLHDGNEIANLSIFKFVAKLRDEKSCIRT